jgi:hypothetical protein
MSSRFSMRDFTEKALPGPDGRQRAAMVGLQVSLALMAFVSLNPYFMWGYQKVYYAVATLLLLASCAGCYRLLLFTRERLILCIAFSLFLIYLSLLPKVLGGTTRWFFLIPFTVALLALRHEDLQKAFEKFYWIFALSLAPGILVWIWLVAGLPIEFQYMRIPPQIAQREVTEYFAFPGAVFLQSNAMTLPNGGIVYRLCGMYDEPGTVGTISALCLAVTRFRLGEIRGGIAFVAGIMSFSIAFAVLMAVGIIVTSVASRRPWLLMAALVSAGVGAIPLSGMTFGNATQSTHITVLRSIEGGTLPEEKAPPTVQYRYAPPPDLRLRYSVDFDNRALPEMRELFEKYRGSLAGTLLIGLGSDASIIFGAGSAVWTSVLTNYGIIGFVWLFILYFTPLVYLLRSGRLDVCVILFCTLYLMSFYQRPVIWLPAQVLIYFAGVYWLSANRIQTAAGAISR